MKLDLKFYNSSAVLPGAVNDNNTVTLAFDKENDNIGINNFWFGSKHLPLTGGTMTGTIKWSDDDISGTNASLILNGHPILIDGGATSDNTLRYFVNWEAVGSHLKNTIILGNYKMLSAWRTWSNTNIPKQTNIEHWVSSTNRDDGTITKYTILDTNNTYLNNYSINGTQYGYTLTLPHVNNNGSNQAFNLLGVGQLHPSFTMNQDSALLNYSIGGETGQLTIQKALTAVSLSGSLYFSNGTNKTHETQDGITTLIPSTVNTNSIEMYVGDKEPFNKIILNNDDLILEKVVANGYSSITGNPRTYDLQISLSDKYFFNYGTDKHHDSNDNLIVDSTNLNSFELNVHGKHPYNKIVLDSNYLTISKVPTNGYSNVVNNNDKTFDLKISLSSDLQTKINKIATLESTIANLTERIAALESRNEVVWDNPAT